MVLGKLKVSELIFEVPKDYAYPERGVLQLFGRAVTRHEKPAAVAPEEDQKKKKKPWFVYLQGKYEDYFGLYCLLYFFC